MRSLDIGTRLAAAFSIITCLLIGIGLFSLAQMERIQHAANDFNQVWLPSLDRIQQLEIGIANLRLEGQRYRATSDPAAKLASADLISGADTHDESTHRLYDQELNRLIQLTRQGRLDDDT
jgi:methyl-accepting chemotaxis protein